MPPSARRRIRRTSTVTLTVAFSLLSSLVPHLAVSGSLPQFDRVRILHDARTVPEAELIDQYGEPFSLGSLNGRVALVLFGFTNCPDVCPLGMQRMQLLEKSNELPKSEVAFVLISVDGERDTPDVMNTFVSRYSSKFIGLTAEPAVVKPIAKRFSVSFFKGHASGDHADYSVSHSPQIFVVDTNGRIRAELYNASLESMLGVVTALLNENNNEK